MVLTSTPFITYEQINVEETELFGDAWGFSSEFDDVIRCLGEVDTSPADRMADHLIEMIRQVR